MKVSRSLSIKNILFIYFILIFGACGTFKKERTYSKDGLTVTYRSLSRFGNDVTRYRITPPSNLTVETVSAHLLSLWHRRIQPPGKAKPVFTQKQVDTLGPLLVKAFRKIKSNKYLHFEFQSPKGWTEGDVFASVDKLHWRMLKIDGEVYSNDPLRIRKPTWKLVRTKGQRFHKVHTAIDQKSQANWIIADLGLKAPRRRETPRRTTSNLELKKKLKTLKELLGDGLIDENEYRQKKKILLNQHL